ncbi:hypothetical protein [Paractinoplanes atraurantiacus]|uniref:Bacterial CdiA-CT RNAse A domain-containing protein n=1 Tax=Paractinoplanes atraurantiacus TaxID=1036182 RepID=A0A285HFR8_9ACTN|nr:hypothetical protein [Actinoplanes atraurantiacus]SNY34580.1 hypothetical protein SAMN05421748_104304 [Actinoplanes atraurantiacus]
MTAKPKSPGGGDSPHRARGPGSHSAESVAGAQNAVASAIQAGTPHPDGAGAIAARATPDTSDPELSRVMDVYERLGADPPRFRISANDAAHEGHGAHTIERHGSQIPLERADPGSDIRTVEGRIYGDDPWGKTENKSFKWDDPTIMTREVNEHVQRNWEAIRSDLALKGFYEGTYEAGHRVGHGYYNSGMFGFGPRQAEYATVSRVVVRIRLAPGSDPPEPFLVTAFPSGFPTQLG